MGQDRVWVLNILKDGDSTGPRVNLHHHFTTLTVKKCFFPYCFNGMSCIFMCLLLHFLISDSSEKGLTSSSLLFWVFLNKLVRSSLSPLFSRLISPATSATPHVPDALIPSPLCPFICLPAAHAHVCLILGSLEQDTALRCASPRQSGGEGSPPLTCWQCSS